MLPVMDTGNHMSRASRKDYLQRISSLPKGQPSGEATHPGRVLRQLQLSPQACHPLAQPSAASDKNGAPPAGAWPNLRLAVISVLKAVWGAADYPWSVRLQALLPEWMPWIRRRFRLTPEVERQLLRISPVGRNNCVRADSNPLSDDDASGMRLCR